MACCENGAPTRFDVVTCVFTPDFGDREAPPHHAVRVALRARWSRANQPAADHDRGRLREMHGATPLAVVVSGCQCLTPYPQEIVNGLLAMASEAKRTGDLFSTKNIFARAQKLVGGLKVRDVWFLPLAQRALLTRGPAGSGQCVHAAPAATREHSGQHQQGVRISGCDIHMWCC